MLASHGKFIGIVSFRFTGHPNIDRVIPSEKFHKNFFILENILNKLSSFPPVYRRYFIQMNRELFR